jgi:MFS family permease
VIIFISVLSAFGGLIMLFLVPDGPFRRRSEQLRLSAFLIAFRNNNFRAYSFGYFGHMWELYTFWAFVPVILTTNMQHNKIDVDVPFLSFLIIASGGAACILSGLLSQHFGAKKLATISLFLSCLCCLASPFFLFTGSTPALVAFLLFWGLAVIADSPMFSTLVAQNAPQESRGTALTFVNCIGFSITIISIQATKLLSAHIDARYVYILLAAGPVLGLISLLKNKYIS